MELPPEQGGIRDQLALAGVADVFLRTYILRKEPALGTSPGGKPIISRLSREPPEKSLQNVLQMALEKKRRFGALPSSFPIFKGYTDVFAHTYGQKSLVIIPHTSGGGWSHQYLVHST